MKKSTPKVIENINLSNVGVSLWKDSWLQKITTLSGELTKTNEYQVHMWSLVMRKTFEDNSIFDITIPLVIFNYPQSVSSAHIDFEGKDVAKMAENTKELAIKKANNLLANENFVKKFKDFEPIVVNAMTLHKHP